MAARLDARRIAATSATLALHVLAVLLLMMARALPPARAAPVPAREPALALLDLAGSRGGGSPGARAPRDALPPPRPSAMRARRDPPERLAPRVRSDLPVSIALRLDTKLAVAAPAAPSEATTPGTARDAGCAADACKATHAGAGTGGGASIGALDGDDVVGGAPQGGRGRGRYRPIDYRGVPVLPDRNQIPPRCRSGRGCVLFVRVFVAADGTRGALYLLKGSGVRRYDQLVLRAAQSWQFQPRRVDGRAVDGWAVVPIVAEGTLAFTAW